MNRAVDEQQTTVDERMNDDYSDAWINIDLNRPSMLTCLIKVLKEHFLQTFKGGHK